MNMFARFDENPAMTLRVVKETKRYGRTDGRTDNVKTVYPLQTKFAGGIIIVTLKHKPTTTGLYSVHKSINYTIITFLVTLFYSHRFR